MTPGESRKDGAPTLRGTYWQVVLEALPVAAYLCDSEGLISYYNRRAAILWGREPQLLDSADRFCGSFRLFSSRGEPIRHEECWMAMAIREGREFTEREIIVERPDGERRFVLAHANPFYDAEGRLEGAVNVLLDVTEEAQSRRAQEHLAAIVESSDDAIVSKSLDGIVQSWNSGAERIFGYSAKEAIGRHISLIIPSNRLAEEDEILTRLRAGERIDHFESERVRKDGQPVQVSLTISPVRDERGDIVGASKVSRDISDRKRTEQALREANRMKDEFLATLAHELRNPLAPIRTSLELLKVLQNDPSSLDNVRDVMERQTEHLSVLVDDLVDISRISRGKLKLRKTVFTLEQVVDSAVESCRSLIEQERHDLTVEMPEHPLYLHGDRHRLAQILSNLLNNAARYTPRGGRISIQGGRDGADAVTIRVRDSGLGIPPDMHERIFEMFAQIERPGKASSGLGIGLSLVKSLVQMHGGTISVRSEGAGAGTEFLLRLPIAVDRPREEVQTPHANEVHSLPWRILVEDDNRAAADMLGVLLKNLGGEIRIAYDGEEALSAAAEFRPDIVLMDLDMPKINGYEAAKRLREEPWGNTVKLVALTGWSQPRHKKDAVEAGFDHYLVKPIGLSHLRALFGTEKATGE